MIAVAVGGEQPLHSDAISDLGPGHAFADLVDDTCNLVAEYAWKGGEPHFTEDNAEVAAADTAGVHFDENFSGFRLRNGTVFDDDRGIHFWGDNGFHHVSSLGEIQRKGSLAQRIG